MSSVSCVIEHSNSADFFFLPFFGTGQFGFSNPCASNPCPTQHHCLQEGGRYVCKRMVSPASPHRLRFVTFHSFLADMDATCSLKRAFYRCPTVSGGKDVALVKEKCDVEKSCLSRSHSQNMECHGQEGIRNYSC